VYAGDRMMARAFLSQILLAVFNGRVGTWYNIIVQDGPSIHEAEFFPSLVSNRKLYTVLWEGSYCVGDWFQSWHWSETPHNCPCSCSWKAGSPNLQFLKVAPSFPSHLQYIFPIVQQSHKVCDRVTLLSQVWFVRQLLLD
jgi:hypothetical protein